jgi:hypothetical protein
VSASQVLARIEARAADVRRDAVDAATRELDDAATRA